MWVLGTRTRPVFFCLFFFIFMGAVRTHRTWGEETLCVLRKCLGNGIPGYFIHTKCGVRLQAECVCRVVLVLAAGRIDFRFPYLTVIPFLLRRKKKFLWIFPIIATIIVHISTDLCFAIMGACVCRRCVFMTMVDGDE